MVDVKDECCGRRNKEEDVLGLGQREEEADLRLRRWAVEMTSVWSGDKVGGG